jgi:hypothetical protein
METMKFKVGDKVRVKSLEWYNENKNAKGRVYKDGISDIYFTEGMTFWCGKIVQIEKIYGDTYYLVDGSFCHWQDWMFEDEVVAPDAPDALKKWTIREARKYLAGKKLFCTNYQESENLQRKLLECGCFWSDIIETIEIERWAIYISYSADGQMYHDNKDVFQWSLDKRDAIRVEDVLQIEIIPEDKPKFDPKTLKPYDRVLVRDLEHEVWVARFFDYYECGFYYTTSSACSWKCCVPYCDETKHLHRTTNEAPEFYRI